MNTRLRMARLRSKLDALGADGALITTRENVRYLSGFDGSAGTLVLAPGYAYLLTDNRYIIKAKNVARGVCPMEGKSPAQAINDLPGRPTIVYEEQQIAAATLEKIAGEVKRAALTPETGLVEGLRAVKDTDEIEAIRRACAISDQAWIAFQSEIRPGVTETYLAGRLENIMRDVGASGTSFDSIIASGPNSAIPHHAPTDRTLRDGDLLKCDFGCMFGGYASDTTRTLIIGEPTERQREIYGAVYAAQTAAVEMLAPGVEGDKVVDKANEIITSAGFEKIPHGLGHGVGLRVHDSPGVGKGTTLQPGHVVTIEPGVYIEGLGGVRIEDVVAITETGHDVLTACPKPAELSGPG